MMQPTENGLRSDSKTDGQLMPMDAGRNNCLRWLRNSRSQCRMRASTIVVTNEFLMDEAQVPLADRNQVIQTLAPDRSDEPFTIRIGFRRANWRSDRTHPKLLQRCIKRRRKNRIAIVNNDSIRMRLGEDFVELLSRPFGSRMRRDIEVQNPPRAISIATKT